MEIPHSKFQVDGIIQIRRHGDGGERFCEFYYPGYSYHCSIDIGRAVERMRKPRSFILVGMENSNDVFVAPEKIRSPYSKTRSMAVFNKLFSQVRVFEPLAWLSEPPWFEIKALLPSE